MKKDNIEIFGEKVGMTQFYGEGGILIPVTVVKVEPCPVVQIKTKEGADGYSAVQIGYKWQKKQRQSKGELGHTKKAGLEPLSKLKEFRSEAVGDYEVGKPLVVKDLFAEGEKIDVIAKSKGRGFQGVVKRWGFSGGPSSHGSMSHRRGGSYGQCQDPGEVDKGRKMPGRMGGNRCTVQNIQVVKIIEDKNLILLKGSVPGANGGILTIRKAKKQQQSPASAA